MSVPTTTTTRVPAAGTAARLVPAPSHVVPDPCASGRRILANALTAHDYRAAEAQALLLLAQGQTVVELFDRVIAPLVDQRHDALVRGHVEAGDLAATTQAAARLLARLPFATGVRHRGPAMLLAPPGEQHLLWLYAFAGALEQVGFEAQVFGELPLDRLVSFVLHHQRRPTLVCLTLHEPPRDTAGLRAAVRHLRGALPGTRVLLGGRAVRLDPVLPAAVGCDGGAGDVAGGLRLVERLLLPLTGRELETLRLVADGRTNRQIATALGIAPSTVKSSLDRVFEKLHVPDRAAAAALAVRRGWID